MMLSLILLASMAIAAPKMSLREIHSQYFKKVYGENFENLKDLKFWYGNYYHFGNGFTPPSGIAVNSAEHLKYVENKAKSYLPTEAQVKKICMMKPGSTEVSEGYKNCVSGLKNDYRLVEFSPVYDKPNSKALLVGFFNRVRGEMYYRGEYIDLRPFEEPEPEGTIDESSTEIFLAPVLDYRIVTEDGWEREWMRLPTMGQAGEAWVGTTDIEGPLPVLDLQRTNKLTKRSEVRGLGLTQLSKSRLLNNSCYMGIDKGHVLFKQFLFPMNWDKSLGGGAGHTPYRFFHPERAKIGIHEEFVKGPLIAEYLEKYKKYPPLVFRLSLIDFFHGLSDQFYNVSQVAMSPGEADRNCDYPTELFYKKIPKDTIVAFTDRYSSVLINGEFRHGIHEYYVTQRKDSPLNKALRGEDLKEPFSIYIHQIHTGD